MKKAVAWTAGAVATVIVLGYGAFVLETRKHPPLFLMSCAETDGHFVGWTCDQVLRHASFRPEQVQDLNNEAGAFYPLLIEEKPQAEERLKLFLAHGVDINAKHKREKGATALHSMVVNGSVENIKLLLKHGAKADVKDDEGRTPLEWAKDLERLNPSPSRAEIVRVLQG